MLSKKKKWIESTSKILKKYSVNFTINDTVLFNLRCTSHNVLTFKY